MHRGLVGMGLAAFALAAPSGATADTGTLEQVPLPGAPSQVTLGPDGANWVTLPTRGTLARVAADGTVAESGALGGAPAGVAVVAGKLWVSLTAAKKIAVVDPANAAAVTTFPTPAGSCGPVAIADGGNGKAVVSLPNNGSGDTCMITALSEVAVFDTTTRVLRPGSPISARGTAYDLLVASGKVWIPDAGAVGGDVVRRTALDDALTVETTYAAAPGSQPNGIAVAPDGQIAVSLFGSGQLARIAQNAANGTSLANFAPASQPFGLATIGSTLFATSGSQGLNPSIRRVSTEGANSIPVPAGASPFDAAPGPDGDVLVTSLTTAEVLRFTSRPPRVSAGPAENVTGTSATIPLTVNAGGNAGTFAVDYGTVSAFGSPAGTPLATGTKDVARRVDLPSLDPGKTYFYRARVTTPEGTATTATGSFTTVGGPGAGAKDPGSADAGGAQPRFTTKVTFTSSYRTRTTRITKIRIASVQKGDVVTVTCTGAGCPAKKASRTVKATVKKAGTYTVSAKAITSAKLRKGAKVRVSIARRGFVAYTALATVRATKKPVVSAPRS